MVDKLLWKGRFFDGTLAFVLPENPKKVCNEMIALGDVIICYAVMAGGMEYGNYITIPREKLARFYLIIPKIMKDITKEFFEALTKKILKDISNGKFSH